MGEEIREEEHEHQQSADQFAEQAGQAGEIGLGAIGRPKRSISRPVKFNE